jgi:hypothetical protein
VSDDYHRIQALAISSNKRLSEVSATLTLVVVAALEAKAASSLPGALSTEAEFQSPLALFPSQKTAAFR